MFPPMLAHEYADDINPTGWWISEKMDGVRAIWDGTRLLSRNGNEFRAPTSFLLSLPPIPLDGELWIGHHLFQETADILKRKTPKPDEWQKMMYFVFDTPNADPFEKRCELIRSAIKLTSRACVLPHQICRDRAHLEACYTSTLESGGEGVMLRAAGSLYESGRSEHLLKYKPTFTTEGTLIATETGIGRCANMVGTIIVKWQDKEVRIGSGLSDHDRKNPPAIGSLIEFEHKGLTNAGVPRHAVFRAVRNYE